MTQRLIDRALISHRSVIVYGGMVPAREVREACEAARGPLDPVDVRRAEASVDVGALRQKLSAQLGDGGIALILLPTEVPPGVRKVLAELSERRLGPPGSDTLQPEATVVAVSFTDQPGEALLDLFDLRIAGDAALDDSAPAVS